MSWGERVGEERKRVLGRAARERESVRRRALLKADKRLWRAFFVLSGNRSTAWRRAIPPSATSLGRILFLSSRLLSSRLLSSRLLSSRLLSSRLLSSRLLPPPDAWARAEA
jgi:hypothetical protein